MAAQPDRLAPIASLFDAVDAASDVLERLTVVFPDLGARSVELADRPDSASWAPAAPSAAHAQPALPGTTSFSGLTGTTAVWHDRVLFALQSAEQPFVVLRGEKAEPMARVSDTNYWIHVSPVNPGRTYTFSYIVGDATIATSDVPVYGPLSYDLPSVKRGTLVARRTLRSSVYAGASTEYAVYCNAGVDLARGAPVMIWHDGVGYLEPTDLVRHRLQIVSDRLVAAGAIPPMVHLLVDPSSPAEPLTPDYPGQSQRAAMRSHQYDAFSPEYGKHLLTELLPDAASVVRLRTDGYSVGSAGLSSGGICAFKLAWFWPSHFSRVLSGIGSFTPLRWQHGEEGSSGMIVSHCVRVAAKRNIRVWLSEGMNDIEVGGEGRVDLLRGGSWPLSNIALANALKIRDYDFHFRYGDAHHNHAQTALDLPEALAWLWRDYDPDVTDSCFTQDEHERSQPLFRVRLANRDGR